MENDWKFSHVGMVVADMQKTLGYMRSLGIYTIPDKEPDLRPGINPEVSGASGSILILDIFCGPLAIELLQPLMGDTVQQRFLTSHGEGVHHICFEVPDMAKARAAMADKGVPVACHIRDLATYYDTAEYGNLFLELRQT